MRNEQDDIVAALKAETPDLALPLHRRRFLSALMRQRAPHAFRNAPHFMQRKLLAGGIAAMVIGVSLSLAPTLTHNAQAKGLVNRAIHRFHQLTPEQRADIDKFIKDDMAKSLEEARAAKDLRILTQSEWEAENKGGPMFSKGVPLPPPGADGEEFAIKIDREGTDVLSHGETGVVHGGSISVGAGGEGLVKGEGDKKFVKNMQFSVAAPPTGVEKLDFKMPVQYLRYTDAAGAEATLGLDEDGTPVMKLVEFTGEHDGHVMRQGKMIFTDGAHDAALTAEEDVILKK